MDEKALEAAIREGSNIADEYLVRSIVTAYLQALHLGSRLTVDGVEAVVAPVEPTPEMMQAALEKSRSREHGLALLPFAYEFNASKTIYRAMLSAGDRG